MNVRKRIIITALCLLASTVHAFGAPKVDMKSYEKDGMRYIEKTYVIDTDADLSDVADGTFELDGYSYSQIDIKSQPVIHKEKKEVCQTKNVFLRKSVKPWSTPMKQGSVESLSRT